jgi:hypothetical protein
MINVLVIILEPIKKIFAAKIRFIDDFDFSYDKQVFAIERHA